MMAQKMCGCGPLDLSIVIPTFNERENVKCITERIISALQPVNCHYEILFIDDSTDDTVEMLEQLTQQFPQVRYVHRSKERGLATAVVQGFAQSVASCLVVMDADLQHPPELLPQVYAALQHYDLVIPSRFVPGGDSEGLNAFRRFVSWAARMIGQVAIKRLRCVSDCTGGFFGLRRSVIQGVTLDPIGWKILIEILVKGHYQTVTELPYTFAFRHEGESKMGLKEQWNYLRHILRLVVYNFKTKHLNS